MSLETVSRKRRRTYPRHFDHDEARRLREENPWRWTYHRLADHFGVSYNAVRRICDPAFRAEVDRRTNEYVRSQRQPCRGGCGRLVWAHMKKRSGYCPRCLGELRTHADVREGELRCTECRRWKPDADFPTTHPSKSRRGHDPCCRACSTRRRREHRQAHPVMEKAHNRSRTDTRRRQGPMALHLVMVETEDGYRVIGQANAASPAAAIEAAVSEPGSYVAVQASRLKPLRVELVQALRVQGEQEGKAKPRLQAAG